MCVSVAAGSSETEKCECVYSEGECVYTECVTFTTIIQELSRSMDVIEEGKVQEDLSETSVTTEKDSELTPDTSTENVPNILILA